MPKAARIFALGGFLLIAACKIEPFRLDFGCSIICSPLSPIPFTLTPDRAYILRGDTVTFYAWKCHDGFCESEGYADSRWSIGGDAAGAGIVPGALNKSVALAKWILVHGVSAGRSTITAVDAADSTLSRTAVVHVADTSAITQLRLSSLSASNTVRMHEQLRIEAELIDSAGTAYRTQPADWSLSDSSIARLGTVRHWDGRADRLVEPKATGSVEVTATFLHLSAKLQVTVVP